ncbi:ribonuclease H [Paenibacillus xerothermodurans]|uniref:Ribonuclease H n=1 Tax=Paenibacillus xerothermodurans TaxID=1977292 RepID=A0A2W1NY45_PAEXE|nr:ribonuclease H family protein [Paenibacillus xerothermodurans]PZE19778.1 ribonuclease H [Paenibacillus xerothermodurans]
MAKQKYYVVWEGKVPGIYKTWAECQAVTNGYPQAKFKAYESEAEAQAALKRGWKASFAASSKAAAASSAGAAQRGSERARAAKGSKSSEQVVLDSISVDVGSKGNPGLVEYKGVDTRTGKVIFQHPPIAKGTNNLGEFLAIVHALAYLKQKGSSMTIYSDSVTAISWVRKKAVATNLPRDESTKEIWALVDRALAWLHNNSYSNPILKWDTKAWGEIKADYGRK